MTAKLVAHIENALGKKISSWQDLPVGFGLSGLRIRLADGEEAAVKSCVGAGKKNSSGNLAIEGYMLRELKKHSQLPVPEVHYCDSELLVMQWLPANGTISSGAQTHAGELLADLHSRRFEQFGYERDTLIGPLHQPNKFSSNWLEFFREQRLMYMAREARRENSLPPALFERLQKLAGQLDLYLGEPAHPSLIHGDLWGGNIICANNRISGFIDPAIYCADPEIELAFGTMFGTFGKRFFEAYESVSPLEPGFFEQRLAIYNLYPTLVHVRLFGAGYLGAIDKTLSGLGL